MLDLLMVDDMKLQIVQKDFALAYFGHHDLVFRTPVALRIYSQDKSERDKMMEMMSVSILGPEPENCTLALGAVTLDRGVRTICREPGHSQHWPG